MTEDQLNRLVKLSEAPEAPAKPLKRNTRNTRGNPKPYIDGNRWKAVGYFFDTEGNKHKVIGSGPRKSDALASRDALIKTRSREIQLKKLPDGATFAGDYMRFWLDRIKQPQDLLDYKTYEGYNSVLKNWIEPHFKGIRLIDLKRAHIIALFDSMRVAGLSRSSQNQARAVIKPALEYAQIEGHITASPFIGIKLQKSVNKLPDFFEFNEVTQILTTARTLNSELKWHLALLYGLRQGERLGLTWSDISMQSDTPEMKISMQLQRQKGKGLLRVPVKTQESNRSIPLTPSTMKLLKAQRVAYDLGRVVHGESWNTEGFVFWNTLGKPSDASRDQEEWAVLLKSAGVSYKPIHTARKTMATLLDSGDTASRLLGHSSQSVTLKHYRNTHQEAKLSALSELQRRVTP